VIESRLGTDGLCRLETRIYERGRSVKV
jgi:hypothetical protein